MVQEQEKERDGEGRRERKESTRSSRKERERDNDDRERRKSRDHEHDHRRGRDREGKPRPAFEVISRPDADTFTSKFVRCVSFLFRLDMDAIRYTRILICMARIIPLSGLASGPCDVPPSLCTLHPSHTNLFSFLPFIDNELPPMHPSLLPSHTSHPGPAGAQSPTPLPRIQSQIRTESSSGASPRYSSRARRARGEMRGGGWLIFI